MAISLEKGASLSLKKSNGSDLTQVTLGLGWDAAKTGFFGGGEIDLDASAILLDGSKNAVDIVSFSQLRSRDGSVAHAGDNLTGAGEGDDEQIRVDLTRVSSNVQSIVFVITSYSGQKFDKVKNVFARVIDTSAGASTEVVRYDLANGGAYTAKIVAKVTRDGSGWAFTAIGNDANGKVAKNVLADAVAAA